MSLYPPSLKIAKATGSIPENINFAIKTGARYSNNVCPLVSSTGPPLFPGERVR
jgi:hypothetical protein